MAVEQSEELSRAFEELRRTVQGLDRSTSSLAQNLQKELKAATQNLASSTLQAGKSIAQGATGLDALAPVIKATANAFGGVLSIIPVFGKALQVAAQAAGDAAVFITQNIEKTAKSFETIGQVGATTAEGLSGLAKQFSAAKLDIAAWERVLTSSADSLVRYSSLTNKGAEDFSKIVGEMTTSGLVQQLRFIGETPETVAKRTAGFLAIESRLSLRRLRDDKEAAAASAKYIRELDALARLTGQTKEAIEQQKIAALDIPRFRAVLSELGEKYGPAFADNLQNMNVALNKFSPAVAQGFRDLLSGTAANSEAARALEVTTRGQAGSIIRSLRSGEITADIAQSQLTEVLRESVPQFRTLIGVGADIGTMMPEIFTQVSNSGNLLRESFTSANTATQAAINSQDDLTKNVIKARDAIYAFYTALQHVSVQAAGQINKIVTGLATTYDTTFGYLSRFNVSIGKVIDKFNELAGVIPAASRPTVNPNIIAETAGGAVTGTTRGAYARPETRAGRAPGLVARKLSTGVSGLAENENLTDFIQFTPGTGSQEKFSQLTPEIQNRIIAAAREFNKNTGQKLQIQSAYRSKEDHDELVRRFEAGDRNIRVRPAENSLHRVGRAIDVGNFREAERYLAEQGLRHNKYTGSGTGHFEFKRGGIAAGPTSGYTALLHGTEAVVPLPDGRSIPIESTPQSAEIMRDQIDRLDTLISTMREQVEISSKILAYTA